MIGGKVRSMALRRGEKLGWLGGWAGSFLWTLPIAVIFLLRGQLLAGSVGLLLAALGYGAAMAFSPWRHPATRYWQLMLAPYAALVATVPWALWGFGPQAEGLSWWNLMPLLAVLSPLLTIGARRWRDGERATEPIDKR